MLSLSWMLFVKNDDQLHWPTPTGTTVLVDDADNHTPLSGCYARHFALLQANNELIVEIGIKDCADSYGALTIT